MKHPVLLVALGFAIMITGWSAFAGDDPKPADLPAAVKATLDKEAAGATVKSVEIENEDGKQVYEITVVRNGKSEEIKIAADGKFLGREEEEGGEGEESAVAAADVPAPVKAAAEALIGKTTAMKFEKDTKDGVTVFEVGYETKTGKASATFSPAGDVLEQEETSTAAALPEAVRKQLEAAHPGATIGSVESVKRTYFEVKVTVGGATREILVDAAGRIHGPHKAEK